ncbi:MAG TPA: type IV pilin N-terminal domain-containing protein [Methanocorpusculum sp.]|nr:type IV pilin N-terminal domain-containing protein [Methanocorpusculum sp.]HJK80273.1 type IV pilin N-terminal domain-containing protein [Methanocorpusculum sp.]
MKRRVQENAVSPVVGVMLMLVITVIIAAVVSGFAGNIVSSTEKAPQVQLKYVGVMAGNISSDSGDLGEVGLVFEHKGGEDLSLFNLQLDLKENIRTGGNETTVAYNDAPSATYKNNQVAGESRLSSTVKNRMTKIGVSSGATATPGNTLIKPGDRFIIFADRIIATPNSSYNHVYFIADRGGSTAYSEGEFELSAKTLYSLIDTKSGAIISSGDLSGRTLDYDLW